MVATQRVTHTVAGIRAQRVVPVDVDVAAAMRLRWRGVIFLAVRLPFMHGEPRLGLEGLTALAAFEGDRGDWVGGHQVSLETPPPKARRVRRQGT